MSDPNDDNMEWVRAEEFEPNDRVTKIWLLRSAKGEALLGTVKWYAQWRRYVFYPVAETLYDAHCLWDIADFCARHTTARKEERKAEVKRG